MPDNAFNESVGGVRMCVCLLRFVVGGYISFSLLESS